MRRACRHVSCQAFDKTEIDMTYRNKLAILIGTGLTLALPALAQQAAPLAVGDEWVYRQTIEAPGQSSQPATPRFRINHVNSASQLILAITPGGKEVTTPVWHIAHLLEPGTCFLDVIAGKGLPTEQPCVLPAQGKSWEVNSADTVSSVQARYQVLGREPVQIGTGKYDAWKIDATRTEAEVVYPGVSTPPAPPKRSHTVYWYAPEVKAMVKVVREKLDASGAVVSRQVEELQRFGADGKSGR
jgi:hypothetical protein